MVDTKKKRLAYFFIYILIVLAVMTILIVINGANSPWPWACITLFVLAPIIYMKLVQLPYITWKNIYDVGVEEIDYDHKRLIELMNRIVSASSYKLGDDYTMEIFNKLIDYTKYHLGREEELMDKYDYPDKVNHKKQHANFIKKVNNYCSQLEKDIDVSHHDVFEFLKNWLLNHIVKTDKKLGVYIQMKRSSSSE